jgi:hypothetical protein
LALGVGLLFAARQPQEHRTLIGVGALGSLLHVANHLYDDVIIERGATLHWFSNTLPLFALAALLIAAYAMLAKEPTTKPQRLEGAQRKQPS